jgi:competence protein ComEA
MITVEIVGEPIGEGIYFLPREMKLHELPMLSGVESGIDEWETENEISVHGSAVTISIDRGMLKVAGMPAAKRLALGLPVDLNSASEEELALIPGIGSKTAFKIAMLREKKGRFRLLEDLLEIPGIGVKKLDEIKKFLTLERTIH